MKIFANSLVLLASICVASPVPKDIRSEYKKIEQGFVHADLAKLKSFFDTSFVNIDEKGQKTDYKAFMSQLNDMFKGAKSGTAHEELKSAKVRGDEVDVEFDFKFTIKTAKHVGTGHEVGTDTWKKIKGRWLFVKTVDKSFTYK